MPSQCRFPEGSKWSTLVRLLGGLSLSLSGTGAEHGLAGAGGGPVVAPASDEGRQAVRGFRVPPGWQVDLIAAEPHLANPVAFAFDEEERIYVVETFRLGEGVLDIRGRAGWPSAGYRRGLDPERRARLPEELLDADLANRTVADRERMLRHYFAEQAGSLERQTDRLRRIVRATDGGGVRSTVFAEGFTSLVDGLASGVLIRGGDVWLANIPHLWRLRDGDGDGVADERTSLHEGFGVRVGFLGHDLHGLCWGPDGRLYFTIGDRGASVVTREGRRLDTPDSGAVFRCEPDGSNLELYATGLRNPQELVFDALGNLWTGDNNSDGGDRARWTYVVEGGDSGWHIGWQFIESPNPRGPWNAEGMWRPEEASRIAYLVPPLANIGAGPSGLAFHPGTGLPADLEGHFFLVDFRGGPSGIWTFRVEPKGAGYHVAGLRELLWNALPTDVEVGPDGGLYWTDWVQGWGKTGKGRIYRMHEPLSAAAPEATTTREWLRRPLPAVGMDALVAGLAHPDLRVRRRAQFRLAETGSAEALTAVAQASTNRWARLHAIWGLGQLGRVRAEVAEVVVGWLEDSDPEVRAQAARVLGDLRWARSGPSLERRLGDPEPRPRFFAAIALGRLGRSEAVPGLLAMLRANRDEDPFLRHAGVQGLVGTAREPELRALARDDSKAVRLAAVVALRRLRSPGLVGFLDDLEPAVVLEAARAIHDLPVTEALPALAGLLRREGLAAPLARRVLNANLRLGGAAQAAALAGFAARAEEPLALKVEALQHLGRFARPSGRDQVTGLWRPVTGPREEGSARKELARGLDDWLDGPVEVQAAAVEAIGRLEAKDTAPVLRRLARDRERAVRVRRAGLSVLGGWNDPELAVLVRDLAADGEASMRAEAVRWASRLGADSALPPIRAALETGNATEQQAALASLATLRGAAADAALLEWLVRGTEGRVPEEVRLDLLEAGQRRDSEAVKAALARYEASLADPDPVRARRHLLRGGNAEAGRRVFQENETAQCLRCHKAGGEGGVVGPDLAGVGSRLTRADLLASMVSPNAAVAAGYENVSLETRDGREFSGTVQSETGTELVLNTVDHGVVTVRQDEIADRRKGLSSMPEGLADLLSPRELRDLVEYLASLRAP